jgi:hypothetical protein
MVNLKSSLGMEQNQQLHYIASLVCQKIDGRTTSSRKAKRFASLNDVT